jgi:HAD superfamily hydrolase (TIGR01484 family)
MDCPRAVIFDLDDTLAESFKAPTDAVLDKLGRLLSYMPVAIMTGAGFKRMESQFLPRLASFPNADRFYLFPNSSAQCYVHENNEWKLTYNFALTSEERVHIKNIIQATVENDERFRSIPHWGERLFDREAQVAYTPVGIEASLDEKKSWDADGTKRRALFETLKHALPEFSVLLGGKTTIDVTRKDINKAYGVQCLAKELQVPPSEMLYIGDAFHDDGNDTVVLSTGIRTRPISGPEETEKVIDGLLKTCEVSFPRS